MPSFPFSVVVETTPSIEVYGVNISYEEMLNSFVAYWYLLEKIFIQTNRNEQINQPIIFNKFDSVGLKNQMVLNPTFDPYAKQSTDLEDVSEYKLILDGWLIMAPAILPLTRVQYTFFTCRGYLAKCLDAFGVPNKALVKNV